MKKYKYLFGPVPSRRLGRSLGVDLIPYKTCSQDCVFCQLGRTPEKTIIRNEYVPIQEVCDEINEWLKKDGNTDHVTLAGSGEPTLHSNFGEVLKYVKKKSSIQTVLLTNGSLFYQPEVREAASQAHIVKVSVSAWDQNSFGWINRPHQFIDFNQMIEGQKAFCNEFKGVLWVEVFLVAGMNSMPSDVSKISALVEQLKPNRIHLNTAVRPPAEDFVKALSRDQLATLCNLFNSPVEIIAAYKNMNDSETSANEEAIFSMLTRRPCTAEDIAGTFGMHFNEVSKYIGNLLRKELIHTERTGNDIYYIIRRKEA
ncbi:MAG: radical SAM protein [Candidatus Magnetomorum sp.]|nr:radical SAM protein [Candidatus Magnetomorum sp.]